jgi:hypothetical protein
MAVGDGGIFEKDKKPEMVYISEIYTNIHQAGVAIINYHPPVDFRKKDHKLESAQEQSGQDLTKGYEFNKKEIKPEAEEDYRSTLLKPKEDKDKKSE